MQRRFEGQRALRTLVRTAHIGSAGVTLGAVVLGVPAGSWPIWAALTGSALVADELVRHGEDWLRYLSAWAILAKVTLLALGVAIPSLLGPAVWAAVAVGGVMSHAPGRLRQYPLWGEPGPCATRQDPGTGCR